MGCLHDPANVQQTSSKSIQNTCANAGRLLDRVNTLQAIPLSKIVGNFPLGIKIWVENSFSVNLRAKLNF